MSIISGVSEGESNTFGEMAKPGPSSGSSQLVTQFSRDMFRPLTAPQPVQLQPQPTSSGDTVAIKMAQVNAQISELRREKQEIERNIAIAPNLALQNQLREKLASLELKLRQREAEAEALSLFS